MDTNTFLGVAYYPEAWDISQVETDLDKMRDYGIGCVRIAEFAWKTMEPEEGKFDFSLFRKVVDECKKRGMYVIMGTPAACPPIWLAQKCPDIYARYYNGKEWHHGARRNTCFNSENYIFYSDRITEEMAREFGGDDNIIGWQIDNEIDSIKDYGCVCPRCTQAFRDWVSKKFGGDVDKFNREMCTGVFSMKIDDFSQLDRPYDQWYHPGIRALWMQCKEEETAQYIARQRAIIKKYSSAPVGTDMMPTFTAMSYAKVAQNTDVMQFNEYAFDRYAEIYPWFNYVYNSKKQPFWQTETSCCWNGSATSNYMRPHGFVAMNGWSALVSGAENVNYWLWRAHYGAHELMHGSVIESNGRDRHIKGEVMDFAESIRRHSDFIKGTRPTCSGLAMIMSCNANIDFMTQSMYYIDNKPFDYREVLNNTLALSLLKARLRPEFLTENGDFSDAKVLFTPFLPDIQTDGLDKKILDWVENGGVWIAGPLTDVRTCAHAKFIGSATGVLEKAADITIEFTLPAYDANAAGYREISMQYASSPLKARQMSFDAIRPGKKAKTLAAYRNEEYLDGYAAITETPFGKGKIVVLGCLPDNDALIAVLNDVCGAAGITPFAAASDNVMAVERSGSYGETVAFIETEYLPGSFTAPFEATDILSGKKYKKGEVAAIDKYQVAILKKDC